MRNRSVYNTWCSGWVLAFRSIQICSSWTKIDKIPQNFSVSSVTLLFLVQIQPNFVGLSFNMSLMKPQVVFERFNSVGKLLIGVWIGWQDQKFENSCSFLDASFLLPNHLEVKPLCRNLPLYVYNERAKWFCFVPCRCWDTIKGV